MDDDLEFFIIHCSKFDFYKFAFIADLFEHEKNIYAMVVYLFFVLTIFTTYKIEKWGFNNISWMD